MPGTQGLGNQVFAPAVPGDERAGGTPQRGAEATTMFLILLRRLFSASRRAARPTTRPHVEQLEGRALPSATAPTATVSEAAPVRHAKIQPALNAAQKHRADQ